MRPPWLYKQLAVEYHTKVLTHSPFACLLKSHSPATSLSHKFTMSEFLRTDVQNNVQVGLQAVINLLQATQTSNSNEPNDAYHEALQHLQNLTGTQRPQVHQVIENFVFTVPDMTLQEFFATLGSVCPVLDSHYTDRNSFFRYNANPLICLPGPHCRRNWS